MTPVRVAFGVILRDGRCFLQRRSPRATFLPGLWEFPGGKLEAGEAPREALLRELREEVRWEPERLQALPSFSHAYGARAVELHPFLCQGSGSPSTVLAWGWFTAAEGQVLPVPEANRRLLENLDEIIKNSEFA